MTAAPDLGGAVVVDAVSKSFRRPHQRVHTLKERALHPFRSTDEEEQRVLRDVSFAVGKGEFFGIVGRNGSGKSTLLKCLAGIYATDHGRIYVDGRLSAFIELGVGFNMDLPARDNVVINATLLGLSPREARRRFGAIIDFAELHDAVDVKLKNYSSGMLVRLAFAVMIQVDADVLLIDEVLAVGDASFQQKCFDEFARVRAAGKTVLLVTHDMGAVQRFCDRALLLEDGVVRADGDPSRVANQYLEVNFGRPRDAEPEPPEDEDAEEGEHGDTFGDGSAEILEAWFENESGERVDVLHAGSRCGFAARVRFHEQADDPLFGMALFTGLGQPIVRTTTRYSQPESGRFAAGEEMVFRVRFDNVLAPDRYAATPAVVRAGTGGALMALRDKMVSVVVTGTRHPDALLDLPYDIELERGGSPAAQAAGRPPA